MSGPAFLHLSAGTGPAECSLAVRGLAAALAAEAAVTGIGVSVENAVPEGGGLRSVLVRLDGPGAGALAASWCGSVLWTCPSPLRPRHRRKNWFVTVARVTPPEPGAPGFRESDLRWETFRAGGAGGQHVNVTDSAVRLRHLPSGLVVECRAERSQHRNRAGALLRLGLALAGLERDRERAAAAGRRSLNLAVEGRGDAAVRAYRGPAFERVR